MVFNATINNLWLGVLDTSLRDKARLAAGCKYIPVQCQEWTKYIPVQCQEVTKYIPVQCQEWTKYILVQCQGWTKYILYNVRSEPIIYTCTMPAVNQLYIPAQCQEWTNYIYLYNARSEPIIYTCTMPGVNQLYIPVQCREWTNYIYLYRYIFAAGWLFSPGTPVSSTNKPDPQYNWNIVERRVKHHNNNSIFHPFQSQPNHFLVP